MDDLEPFELDRLADDAERDRAAHPDEFYREGEELSPEDQALIAAAWGQYKAARPDGSAIVTFGGWLRIWLSSLEEGRGDYPFYLYAGDREVFIKVANLIDSDADNLHERLRAQIEEAIRLAQITVHIPVLGPGFKDVAETERLGEAIAEIFSGTRVDVEEDPTQSPGYLDRVISAARRVCRCHDEFGSDPGVLGYELECLQAALDGRPAPLDEAPPR